MMSANAKHTRINQLYQVDDGVEALQLAVNDDLKFLLVIQVGQQLDEGGFCQTVQVNGGHLPVPLCCRVQDLLQYRQTWVTEGQRSHYRASSCIQTSRSTAEGRTQRIDTLLVVWPF